MYSSRRYRKLDWWDFLTVIDQELEPAPTKETYFNLLEELRERMFESVSEGATFKMRAPARDILKRFETRLSNDESFASQSDFAAIKLLVSDIDKNFTP